MDLKGSKTEKSLLAAFAGESQARTRYGFFFSAAKKEGYELPEVPWTFQQRNKLAVHTSAYLFGAARAIKAKFKG